MIRAVYTEVKLLELISIPENVESNYDPLEELDNGLQFVANNVTVSGDNMNVGKI